MPSVALRVRGGRQDHGKVVDENGQNVDNLDKISLE